MSEPTVVERRAGRGGELVLRRGSRGLEVISDGAFLIAAANEVSSRALVGAARPYLTGDPVTVLIGGLGMGFALDEALNLETLAAVTVVEYEPVIVEWFEKHMCERASRAARDARSHIVVGDVLEHLRAGEDQYDLILLDTDNGPGWLVREANAPLYGAEGMALVRAALRPRGVAVFWSTDRYAWFEDRLARWFAAVVAAGAHDSVDGRAVSYTMYVGLAQASV